jgi:hypothetical protein
MSPTIRPELDVAAGGPGVDLARQVADHYVAARGLQVDRSADRDADDELDLDRRPGAKVEAHRALVARGGGDGVPLLLKGEVELLQQLVGLGLAVGADVLLGDDLHLGVRGRATVMLPPRVERFRCTPGWTWKVRSTSRSIFAEAEAVRTARMLTVARSRV